MNRTLFGHTIYGEILNAQSFGLFFIFFFVNRWCGDAKIKYADGRVSVFVFDWSYAGGCISNEVSTVLCASCRQIEWVSAILLQS